MRDEIFFDTSILVYAFTRDEKRKHEICKRIVKRVFEGKLKGVISNQVLAELFFVLVKKKGIDEEKAETIVDAFILSDNWRKVNYSHKTVERAKKLSIDLNIPFWDSLIIATLLENGIRRIYTENERDFRKVREIKVMNPLK